VAALVKNQIISLEIIDYSHEGLGVAKIDGLVVFVHGALRGEKITSKILSVKKGYGFAKVEEVLVLSKERVTPLCKFFPKCGGCGLQHMSYKEELDFKKGLITKALSCEFSLNTNQFVGAGIDRPNEFEQNHLCAFGRSMPAPTRCFSSKVISFNHSLEIVPSLAEYHYRNKCALPVRKGKSGEILIGFFRKKSHEVVDINECILQNNSIRELVAGLKSWMQENNILPYCEESHTGDIRQITLRVLENQTIVTLVGTKKNLQALSFAKVLQNIYGENFALYYNYHPDKSNVIYGRDFVFVAGNDKAVVIDGLEMRVHPAGFFQVNDSVREKMFAYVESLVAETKAKTVIEAYAGQGILACKLSKSVDKAIAIEICAESITAGKEMAKQNGITNIEYILGDCGQKLGKVLDMVEQFVLIVDPPRSGLCVKTLKAIKDSLPPFVLYISCNPNTLTRDLNELLPYYNLTHKKGFDMFPRTANVETVVMLQLKQ